MRLLISLAIFASILAAAGIEVHSGCAHLSFGSIQPELNSGVRIVTVAVHPGAELLLKSDILDLVEGLTHAAGREWSKQLPVRFVAVGPWSPADVTVKAEEIAEQYKAYTLTPFPGRSEKQVTLNTKYRWTDLDVFVAMLHELGHVLGLGHVEDASSVMFPKLTGNVVLTGIDLAEAKRAGWRLVFEPVFELGPPLAPRRQADIRDGSCRR